MDLNHIPGFSCRVIASSTGYSMNRYPRSFPLSGNVEILLRIPDHEDVERSIAFFRDLSPTDRTLVRADITDRGMIEHRLEGPTDRDVFRIVAAAANGAIVGEGSLSHPRYGWTSHVGEVRIAVAVSHRKIGLGSLLARELVIFALKSGLEKVEAWMLADDSPSIRCFAKLGFESEGVLPKFIADFEGNRHDVLVMSVFM